MGVSCLLFMCRVQCVCVCGSLLCAVRSSLAEMHLVLVDALAMIAQATEHRAARSLLSI